MPLLVLRRSPAAQSARHSQRHAHAETALCLPDAEGILLRGQLLKRPTAARTVLPHDRRCRRGCQRRRAGAAAWCSKCSSFACPCRIPLWVGAIAGGCRGVLCGGEGERRGAAAGGLNGRASRSIPGGMHQADKAEQFVMDGGAAALKLQGASGTKRGW